MEKINSKLVPHELSPAQNETRVVYSVQNIQYYNQQKSFLEYTISNDETWISLNRPPEKDIKKDGQKQERYQVPKKDRTGMKGSIC